MSSKQDAKLATLKPVIQRKDVPATLKAKLIHAIVFPVVTYGCEAWSLSMDERSKLNASERKHTAVHSGSDILKECQTKKYSLERDVRRCSKRRSVGASCVTSDTL